MISAEKKFCSYVYGKFLRDSDEYGQTRFFVVKKRMGNTNRKGGKKERRGGRERERERE